ncbi:transposase [Pseudomonas sp. IT-P260]
MIRFSKRLINQETGFVVIQHSGFILEVAPMRVTGPLADPTEQAETSPSGMCLKVLISTAMSMP